MFHPVEGRLWRQNIVTRMLWSFECNFFVRQQIPAAQNFNNTKTLTVRRLPPTPSPSLQTCFLWTLPKRFSSWLQCQEELHADTHTQEFEKNFFFLLPQSTQHRREDEKRGKIHKSSLASAKGKKHILFISFRSVAVYFSCGEVAFVSKRQKLGFSIFSFTKQKSKQKSGW
jgi:hypothetical protein